MRKRLVKAFSKNQYGSARDVLEEATTKIVESTQWSPQVQVAIFNGSDI
jgi:hypothetical protein